MLNRKTISVIDKSQNVVIATHLKPIDFFNTRTAYNYNTCTVYNYKQLSELGKMIVVTDTTRYPCPQNLKRHQPELIENPRGYINYKELQTELAGKNLYFTGGSYTCCLAHTIMSLYDLPQTFQKDMYFFIVQDFTWQILNPKENILFEAPIAEALWQFEKRSFKDLHVAISIASFIFNIDDKKKTEIPKQHHINLTMHYKYQKQYTAAEFYKLRQNHYTIHLIICSLEDIYKYGGAQNIPYVQGIMPLVATN